MTTASFISRQVFLDDPETISQHMGASYEVPADELFLLLTTSENLAKWFGNVKIDEFVYEIEGNASGRIESCRDNSFLVTWENAGAISYLSVEVLADGQAASTLNAGFSTKPEDIPEEFRQKYGSGATGTGWDLSLWGLQRLTQGLDPRGFTEQEYADFVAASSTAWAEADISAGVAEREARARAENTRRFYMGEQDQTAEGTQN
ncbi:hypothetical protein [Corynebacterium pacaense]|uniref:hypothetical protein n=1 Tax=Corynebacterium pacaense TaxID=1816684 RepID=UPI0009BAC316|nr:hypothetical protein [Corynebacterium pacaense]